MSVAGRVCIGFSKPYIAKYVNTSGVISYTGGMVLARGVNVSVTPDAPGSDNIFRADNAAAEKVSGKFTGGSFTLTVDGLLATAEKVLSGLPAVDDGWYHYDDDQTDDYFGVGFIAKYMSDGVISYVPYILRKTSFDPIQTSAETEGEDISWQTQSLSGKILKDDSAKHGWKDVGIEYDTEAEAAEAIEDVFSIS